MSGGAGGDFYIFERGDGQDVFDDLGAFSFGPVKAGIAAWERSRRTGAACNDNGAWRGATFRLVGVAA